MTDTTFTIGDTPMEKNECNVTFKVSGQHFAALEFVHKQFGISKTKQVQFLMKRIDPDIDNYVTMMGELLDEEYAEKKAMYNNHLNRLDRQEQDDA